MKIDMYRMRKMTTLSLLAAIALAGTEAMGQNSNWLSTAPDLLWDNAANWSTPSKPGANNLAFIGLASGTVQLSTNETVEAFRTANGRDVNHTAGTLTVAGNGNQDSFLGEFNNVNWDGTDSIYTMSGSAIYNQTDGKLFILARGGDGQLLMSDNAQMTSNGEIWFGMDNDFIGVISDNAAVSAVTIQMTRFASDDSILTLQDNASLSTSGFFVMSDHPTLSGDSTLKLEGSGLTINFGGLFAREGATLDFLADAGGISTINLDGPSDLFDNNSGLDPQLVVDLTSFAGLGEITLIDKTGLDTVSGQFRGLAEGAVVAGTNGRTISYVGGDGNDVVLSAVPEPGSMVLLALGGLLVARRRRGSDN
ncbi:MAG: PEP-CTERM sorting domain-containing protein [Planctomycetota bacterium]